MADIKNEFSNSDTVRQSLLQQGYAPEVIAGIMGNIDVETGGSYDPMQKQYGGGIGRGLFQMGGGMLQAYNNYLQSNNLQNTSENQIGFMHNILNSGNVYDIGAGHRAKLQEAFKSSDPSLITREFSNRVLHPGKPNLQRRIQSALDIFKQYGDTQ